jgi:hypothetical protein
LDGPVFFEFAEGKQGTNPRENTAILPRNLTNRRSQQLRRRSRSRGYRAPELLGRIAALRECFLHAPSRIDNNLAENALRPIKLGAKNWLFIGSPNAGHRAATMFTLVENCRMRSINPEEYLIDVLARVDDHPHKRIAELTPQGWLKSKND